MIQDGDRTGSIDHRSSSRAAIGNEWREDATARMPIRFEAERRSGGTRYRERQSDTG